MVNNTQRVLVWDGLIRLFHWGLLAAVAFSYYTTKTDGAPFLFPIEVHAQAGYIIIGLLVFRVIWGVVGTVYARFSHFLYPPVATAAYTKSLLARRAPRYASHNPLGGWMVVLMLVSLAFQSLSGLFLSDDIFFQGPLYGLVGRDISGELATLHAFNSDLLLVLISVHVLAIVAHQLQGEHLVAAMVTGIKHFNHPPHDIASSNFPKRRFRAVIALLFAVSVAGWLWFY